LDPKTGHYYNSVTEQYYESATGFYYCIKDGQCFYYDMATANYVPCVGIGNPSAPQSDLKPIEVPKAKSKSKAAAGGSKKKGTQDLEKWSQATNDLDQPLRAGQPLSGTLPGSREFKFEITNFNVRAFVFFLPIAVLFS